MNTLRILVCLVVLAATGFVLLGGLKRSPAPTPSAPDETSPPWFEDITDRAGLSFVHDAGAIDGRYFMPQALGSGAALFDCDGDGRLDILLLNNGGPPGARCVLYRQREPGKFVDASSESGLDIAGHNMGVAIGDCDNDGQPDVLITQFGGVRLFLNRGDGKFADVSNQSGLDNPQWGASAAFFDYDRDGWLDLVIVNYVAYDPTHACITGGQPEYCAPRVFPGQVTRLYRNRGAAPSTRFEDVTIASGLAKVRGPGLGVACADFTGDGWPDIFVANDGQPNRLWVNQHNGTFVEEALTRNLAYNALGQAEAGMGVAIGDVDGNGLFDLFVTHLTEETHTLWLQSPAGLFRDRTAAADLLKGRWKGTGFGTVIADFDNDGWPDVAVANGRISRAGNMVNDALGPHWGRYAERNQVFANTGGGTFRDVSLSNPDLCGTPNVGRGLAWGDIDGDGGVDLLLTTAGGRARLYRNVAPDRGHWLAVRCLDRSHKRDALGAVVTVQAGGRTQVGLISPASSYLCSSEPQAHFGIGNAAWVEAITVTWPDGTSERFPGGAADRAIVLKYGEGQKVGRKSP